MGTSSDSDSPQHAVEDHPHAYGDKLGLKILTANMQGSSPRVWGQDWNDATAANKYRIIPTRMGTRQGLKHFDTVAEDHPHAYGDKQHSYRIGHSN